MGCLLGVLYYASYAIYSGYFDGWREGWMRG
jgi:hypothetical protein